MLLIFLMAVASGCIFGPAGCLILWKRYTVLADSLIHAIIFAAALHSYIPILPLSVAIIAASCALFVLKYAIQSNVYGSNETIYVSSMLLTCIGIISKPGAIGEILFGDILLVSITELYICIVLLIIFYLCLFCCYKPIIRYIINSEIEKINNKSIGIINGLLLLILIVIVAFMIPIFGGIMISSLLILPAMISRLTVHDPKQMLYSSAVVAVALTIVGIVISYIFDTPTSATIGLLGIIVLFFVAKIKKYVIKS